jgi:hypothetical protein
MSRWLSLATLITWLPCAYGQENDAQKLFREMEANICSAKSLHFVFNLEIQDSSTGKKVGEGKGSFDFEANKFRMEREIQVATGTVKQLSISDGKLTYTTFGKAIGAKAMNVPAMTFPRLPNGNFEKTLRVLAEGGPNLLLSTSFLGPTLKFNEDFLKISDFKLGNKEKVGQRDAQVVQFVGVMGPDRTTVKYRVWIYTTTKLPVKMESFFREKVNGPELRQVEIFTTFVVNGPVDPKQFELPKVLPPRGPVLPN